MKLNHSAMTLIFLLFNENINLEILFIHWEILYVMTLSTVITTELTTYWGLYATPTLLLLKNNTELVIWLIKDHLGHSFAKNHKISFEKTREKMKKKMAQFVN